MRGKKEGDLGGRLAKLGGEKLLLDQLIRSGRAERGQTALMVGFGASFSIGSAVVEFDRLPAS